LFKKFAVAVSGLGGRHLAAITSGPPAPSATAVAARCDSAMQAICAPPSPAAGSRLTDGIFTSAARPHRSPYGFMQQAGTMTLLPARAPYSAFRKNCPADRFFCPAD